MHRRLWCTGLILAACLSSACHTISIDVGEGSGTQIVEERKSFFFWGLTPTKTIDVRTHCPNGALAISEETTFVDGLFNFITLGIWAPRTSYYHCAEAK